MSQTTPSPPAERPPEPPVPAPPEPPPRRPVLLVTALVVAVAVIAVLVGVLLWPDDGDDGDTATEPTAPPTTVTTSAPTTGAPTTEAPTTASPTVTPDPGDTATAVFPSRSSGVRYDDPVAAARGFAVDFVGFTDPVVGDFLQGDARSGEVEIRPRADGPVTTVFVRQLGPDGSWWVLGSATANIAVDAPRAGDTVATPVTVSGRALAFEGTVNVEVRENGTRRPLGTGVVTGGGDVPRPFSGRIAFSTPTAPHGAVVFLTLSAEDGSVWEAAVVRIAFA